MKIQLSIVLTLLLFFCINCKDEDVPKPDADGTGLETSDGNNIDLEEDEGELGLIVDARSVAKRGGRVAGIEVIFEDAAYAKFNKKVVADPFLQGQILKWSRTDLTQEEQVAWRDGIDLSVIVSDEEDQIIARYADNKQIIDGSGRTIVPEPLIGEAPAAFPTFSNSMPFLMQSKLDGRVIATALRPYSDDDEMNSLVMQDFVAGELPDDPRLGAVTQEFFLLPNNDDTYFWHTESDQTGKGMISYLFGRSALGNFGSPRPSNSERDYKFEIIDAGGGFFNIKSLGTDAYLINNGVRPGNLGVNPSSDAAKWRFIASNIDWNFDDLGTKFLAPIIPAASTDIAFEQQVRNCSNSIAEVTVGVNRQQSQTFSTTQEESIQLYSSSSQTWDVRASVTVSGSFYGVETSATVEGGYSNTTENSVTQNTTTIETQESTETFDISTTRTQTIQPFESVIIYDAVQFYDHITVPFVQRLRIRGKDRDTQLSLSGQEIVAQLKAQYFNGVILEEGLNYVDVSLKGRAELDSWLRLRTDALNGTPCN